MALEQIKVEDYIKAIYMVCQESGEAAATGEIAKRLELTPGSVTSMMQRLNESGLVEYKVHRGVRLTDQGEKVALGVLRRHRLVELFLAQTLGMGWDEIHDEAENLEHAVSERLIDRIDEYLNFPDRDPHGDPIPNKDGTLRRVQGEPLTECQPGAKFVLEQVLDQAPEFLRYLTEVGLSTGTSVEVVENHPSAGVITLKCGDRQVSLGHHVASKLLVRPL